MPIHAGRRAGKAVERSAKMDKTQGTLLDKLEELDRRFIEVTEQMNDPAVASNSARIVALAKERSRLTRIVEPYRRHRKLAADHDEAQAILDDPQSDRELRSLASGEIETLKHRCEEVLEEIKGLLVMSDESEIDSVMLEVRAGTGGEEAALFAGDLLDMYRRCAESKGWKFEVLSASPTDLGGFREVIVNVKGEGVWSRLGYEGGGHRVQRVPKTEAQGRIHTSAATVVVMPEPKDVEVEINWDKDVNEYTSRAGGPGGQSVNKVESAIRLEHIPTGITVSMRDEKSQHKNRAKARRLLTTRLYDHITSAKTAARADARRIMIGSGDRSQRIRTYNFPQNRCTDHRISLDLYCLDKIMQGDLEELIEALQTYDKEQRLKNL